MSTESLVEIDRLKSELRTVRQQLQDAKAASHWNETVPSELKNESMTITAENETLKHGNENQQIELEALRIREQMGDRQREQMETMADHLKVRHCTATSWVSSESAFRPSATLPITFVSPFLQIFPAGASDVNRSTKR